MCGGVFYREFTKFNDFYGVTTLGKVHTHFFMLGMFVFLIAALFARGSNIESNSIFKRFLIVYNVGVAITGTMLIVRGIMEVKLREISGGLDSAVSGIAGIGHILTGLGIIMLLLALKKSGSQNKSGNNISNVS